MFQVQGDHLFDSEGEVCKEANHGSVSLCLGVQSVFQFGKYPANGETSWTPRVPVRLDVEISDFEAPGDHSKRAGQLNKRSKSRQPTVDCCGLEAPP